jgi:hypothetical protein
VVVIEDAHYCLANPDERSALDDFLSSEPLRTGCALLISRWGDPPTGRGTRKREADVKLGALAPGEAAALLAEYAIDAGLSAAALNSITTLPETMLPGVIEHAATTFRVAVEAGRLPKTSDALVDEILEATDFVVRQVLVGLGLDAARSAAAIGTPLDRLFSMSVLGPRLFDGLATAEDLPLSELSQVGWCEIDDQRWHLTPSGCHCLRRELQRVVAGEKPIMSTLDSVADTTSRLVQSAERQISEEGFDDFTSMLEGAMSWARESGLRGTRLEGVLVRALLPYTIDDVFFPIAAAEREAIHDELRSTEKPQDRDLTARTAELVLAARTDVDAAEFTTLLRAAVDAAAQEPVLEAAYLRALDISAFIGERRAQRSRDILAIRRSLVPRLLQLSAREARDIAVLKWSASWTLNTSALAIAVGDLEAAATLLANSRATIDRLWEPSSPHGASDQLWLKARLASTESLLESDSVGKSRRLREAFEFAFGALEASPTRRRWVTFALRAAKRLSEELRGDQELDALVTDSLQRLARLFGEAKSWPLGVRAQTASLARDVAALAIEPDLRRHLVQRALDLLLPALTEARQLAQLGDSRALLVLSRSYALASACDEELGETASALESRGAALQVSGEAVDATPSAPAWDLHLRLYDETSAPSVDVLWHTDPLSAPRGQISPAFRVKLEAARAWLDATPSWHLDEGKLALWCVQRLWRSEGSLERLAARTQAHQAPWEELNHAEKRQALARKHHQRMGELEAIERRAGPFLDLYFARVRNEAQLQRLRAIYGDHTVDDRPVLQHLLGAKKLWPDSHALAAEEGRYYRYVWNYPAAIASLRWAITAVPRGRDRREITRDLVEVLLMAATHCRELKLSDGTVADRSALVAEARAFLVDLLGFRHISREAANLRDRADLEAGVAIDWTEVDRAFDKVIGDVDEYVHTVVGNLGQLRNLQSDLPERLADLVVREYTSPEVLRNLGSLYLRRVELGLSSDPVSGCRKAYAAFLACRVLEMAWLSAHRESAITSYQRARAIVAAVQATGTATPFLVDLEGKRDLVHLAESLYGRAASQSVGLFHVEAKRRLSEVSRLRSSFGPTRSVPRAGGSA